VYYIHRFFLT